MVTDGTLRHASDSVASLFLQSGGYQAKMSPEAIVMERSDEDAIVRNMNAMTLSAMQAKAKHMRCKEHGEAADISLTVPEGKLQIGGCCEAFVNQVRKVVLAR